MLLPRINRYSAVYRYFIRPRMLPCLCLNAMEAFFRLINDIIMAIGVTRQDSFLHFTAFVRLNFISLITAAFEWSCGEMYSPVLVLVDCSQSVSREGTRC